MPLPANPWSDRDGTTAGERRHDWAEQVASELEELPTAITEVPKAIAGPSLSYWAPSTAYTTSSRVLNPSGEPVQSLSNHTSGAQYNPALWSAPLGYVHLSPGGINEYMKSGNDARNGVLNWIHDSTGIGFLLHLTTTTNTQRAYGPIGIGVDGNGTGITIRNKKSGVGLKIEQGANVDQADAVGLSVSHNSAVAPGVRIEQFAGATAPATEHVSYLSSGGNSLERWVGYNGEAGRIIGSTGLLIWNREITAQGGVHARIFNNAVADVDTSHVRLNETTLSFQQHSGSSNVVYPSRIRTASTQLQFQIGNNSALDAFGSMETVIAIGTGGTGAKKLGFFGVSPVVRPTAVAVTPEAVHAALVTLGLITA